ncbi:hypothetical protein QMT40_001890 [Parvibaculaceae bacterium PLY_AMNH_Bact1]|nr:hypothetical protein QMT40_001890 [Parvibaculaceae bacterium PLY_AMNH_Bact1]
MRPNISIRPHYIDKLPATLVIMLSVSCLLLFFATNARAEVTYDVINVAANDQLNIRAEPSATAEITGTLSFDAKAIKTTGVARQIGRATWVEIILEGRKGWVNAAFVTPTRSPSSLFREPLVCSGTEPFWALQLDNTRGDFDSLAEGKSVIDFQTSRSAHGVPIIWSLKGTNGPAHSPVFALLEETNQCSDGMSDLTYRYSIRIDIEDGPFYAGCCNPHPGQTAP